MNTTIRAKAAQVNKDWHVVDAAGRPLGRVCTEVATLLLGKHKPTWEPHMDDGDFVIVINASKVRLTGNKSEQIVYYRHSGYPGGLKSRTWGEQMERSPRRIIEKTVWGMLPKNRLGRSVLRHLKVYDLEEHPHASQVVGSERAIAKRQELADGVEGDVVPRSRKRLMKSPPTHEPIGGTAMDDEQDEMPAAQTEEVQDEVESAVGADIAAELDDEAAIEEESAESPASQTEEVQEEVESAVGADAAAELKDEADQAQDTDDAQDDEGEEKD